MPPDAPAHLSEEQIISLVAYLAGGAGGDLAVGIGDDCAVLGGDQTGLVVTTDLLVQGSHFDLELMSPADVGHRSMAANLSDLAAMGARPAYGFLSLGMPARPTAAFVSELVGSMVAQGRAHGLKLAGGDTVKAPQVVINLCLLGAMGNLAPVLRSGGRLGDAVCVTGLLGGSGAGLAWLQAGRDPAEAAAAEAVAAHCRPTPRVAAGRALAESGRVHAMMDLSDGLAADLPRLARASGLGAAVEAEAVPISPAALAVAPALGGDALGWALGGGEDFELLFTCDPGEVPLLAQVVAEAAEGLTVTQVGRLTQGPGVTLIKQGEEEPITYKGFDHFQEPAP
ncbi:thiamine-phosphate kinase [Desulfoferula mesophila]|uniref:Thiamine-monophosphate kinase n=1 Tax=Desulfoferula mesophila TaxID=3058419 RepID=A0AAU9E9R5_9BACT|nr:thiamine-monophosphate kinase [Desulfoferula mesophilus]